MKNDIIIVVCFIIITAILCKIWSFYVIRQYKKKLNIHYQSEINNAIKSNIINTENYNNNDYEISKAIKNINMSKDIKIKINDSFKKKEK